MKLLILLGTLASFFVALMGGECQSYVDDGGHLMTACVTTVQAPDFDCEVEVFYGRPDLAKFNLYGRAAMMDGAVLDESADLPAMRCTLVDGHPMVELWSESKAAVGWVALPWARR